MLDNEHDFVPKRLPGGRVFKNKILQLLKSKGVDVPSNYHWTIHYKDKNPYNLDLENIILVSAEDWFRLNSQTQWAARDRTLKDPHFDIIKFIEKESESTMESIYNQMNKIDDKESLNERYNVRTLKDVKKLTESSEMEGVTSAEVTTALKELKNSWGGVLRVKKGAVKYTSEERDFIRYAKMDELVSALNKDKITKEDLVDDPGLVLDYFTDEIGVHHAFEISEFRAEAKALDQKYFATSTVTESAKPEKVEYEFDIDKYYTRGNDEAAIAYLDDPDLAEYLYKCETVDSSFKHVCWLMAKPQYKGVLAEHALVELVCAGDEFGEFPAIFVNDRVYDVTHDIKNYLGLE